MSDNPLLLSVYRLRAASGPHGFRVNQPLEVPLDCRIGSVIVVKVVIDPPFIKGCGIHDGRAGSGDQIFEWCDQTELILKIPEDVLVLPSEFQQHVDEFRLLPL